MKKLTTALLIVLTAILFFIGDSISYGMGYKKSQAEDAIIFHQFERSDNIQYYYTNVLEPMQATAEQKRALLEQYMATLK